MPPQNSTELAKLTVAQLKALCKERKISGYSKLSKPALIEKLAGAGPGESSSSIIPPPPVPQKSCKPTSRLSAQPSLAAAAASSVHAPSVTKGSGRGVDTGASSSAQHGTAQQVQNPSANLALTPAPSNAGAALPASVLSSSPANAPEPPASPAPFSAGRQVSAPTSAVTETQPCATVPAKRPTKAGDKPQTKKAKIAPSRPAASKRFSITLKSSTQQASLVLSSSVALPSGSTNASSTSRAVLPEAPRCPSPPIVQPSLAKPATKRFKPLVFGSRKSQNAPLASVASRLSTSTPRSTSANNFCAAHLDFPPSLPMPALHSISLPPPLSQRKRVQRWAIILRGLDDASRRQCALVSRTFRYAIYLSAIHIIDHDFRGKRTLKDMKPYSHAMTNFWPYLRLLQEEAAERERIYSRSVLGRLADSGRAMSISPRLWGCPDHDSQAAIASRFVFTSFWFAVSIGGRRSEDWLRGTVVDAQEVVPGEIWSIAVQYLDSATNTFRATRCYVLEPTCEVIGTSAELPGASIGATHQPRLDLRVDWSAYIDRWARDTSRAPNGLFLQHLNWANHEEYDRGISKLWTKRTVQEGALGQAKRAVAERYIFACVVANSVSGVWMSATEMAQDFAGLPSRHAPAPTKTLSAGAPVNMFLPATHHVESVHFTTSSKLPLHPALAVVQTPAREYFVLRDNGFEVGSEEEGVAPLWREILCCDSGGLPTKPVQPL